MLTPSFLLKPVKAWGYACGDFRFADLTLPREGIKPEPRSFTDDEVRKIIANGETIALRTYDVDFAKHIIRVRQSVDAATRLVCAVKSKASSADLPMPKELEARLRTHLQGTITRMSCSLSKGAAGHSQQTSCARTNFILCW